MFNAKIAISEVIYVNLHLFRIMDMKIYYFGSISESKKASAIMM